MLISAYRVSRRPRGGGPSKRVREATRRGGRRGGDDTIGHVAANLPRGTVPRFSGRVPAGISDRNPDGNPGWDVPEARIAIRPYTAALDQVSQSRNFSLERVFGATFRKQLPLAN
ncbi:hypothetical protein GCM10010341_62480 [Streptomyces noursei]|nr:hypothetical protein GCM10010341_62480 [Streptomyces noursei]